MISQRRNIKKLFSLNIYCSFFLLPLELRNSPSNLYLLGSCLALIVVDPNLQYTWGYPDLKTELVNLVLVPPGCPTQLLRKFPHPVLLCCWKICPAVPLLFCFLLDLLSIQLLHLHFSQLWIKKRAIHRWWLWRRSGGSSLVYVLIHGGFLSGCSKHLQPPLVGARTCCILGPSTLVCGHFFLGWGEVEMRRCSDIKFLTQGVNWVID